MALLSRCWADEALAVVGLALGCCAAVLVALAVVGLAVDCYAAPCLLSCRCCDVLPLVDVIFLDSRAMLPCRWTAVPVQSVEQSGCTALPGVYSIRTSGYSQFAMQPIPKDGAVGTVLGIYAIYSKQSTFTGGERDYAQYQISVSRLEDLDFKAEDLLTETEADDLARWAYSQGYAAYDPFNPPVKNDPMGGMEGGE